MFALPVSSISSTGTYSFAHNYALLVRIRSCITSLVQGGTPQACRPGGCDSKERKELILMYGYRCMVIVTRRRIWHYIRHQRRSAHHHHRKPRRNVRGVLYLATQDNCSWPGHPRRTLHITSQGNKKPPRIQCIHHLRRTAWSQRSKPTSS